MNALGFYAFWVLAIGIPWTLIVLLLIEVGVL